MLKLVIREVILNTLDNLKAYFEAYFKYIATTRKDLKSVTSLIWAEMSNLYYIPWPFLTLPQEQRLTSSLVTVLVNVCKDFIAYTCLRNAPNVD